VTNAGNSADRSWQDGPLEQTGDLPAVYASWEDAEAYAKWLSAKTRHQYRLLTESEYEFAEQAGTTTAYWWGEDARLMCSYASGKECHHDRPTAPLSTRFVSAALRVICLGGLDGLNRFSVANGFSHAHRNQIAVMDIT
jgi:hypothetical protein